MNIKICQSQITGINLIKNLWLCSVRVPLETLPTNAKLKFNCDNNDSKGNYSNSNGNNSNEYKYNEVISFLMIIIMIIVMIKITFYSH